MSAPRKRKRTLWWVIGISALIIAAIFFLRGGEKTPSVTTGNVSKKDITASVTESGSIEPVIEVPISPDVSGEIIALFFKEGDSVRKGDLLVTIKPDNYKAALEQSEASLNSAKADYMQAQAALEQSRANYLQDSVNYYRNKQLFEQKVISQLELETSQVKYEVSRSQFIAAKQSVLASFYRMKSSEASLKQSRENLNKTNIYASMDGILTMMSVEVGQRVVGTGQMAGTEIIKIADLSRMQMVVEINENDIINLHLGDSASIEVDAFDGKSFFGKVTEIAYSASKSVTSSTDQVTNFKVKVDIDPKSYMNDKELISGLKKNQSPFRPGMSGVATIFTKTKTGVLTVPIQSVTLKRSEGPQQENMVGKREQVVYVFESGSVKMVTVETGISDADFIEITSGDIQENMKVVTGPYNVLTKHLKDGLVVTEMTPEDLEKKTSKKKD